MNGQRQQNARSKRARQYWQRHLDAWKTSGLKQIDYCRQHDVRPKSFILWKGKLGVRTPGSAENVEPKLIPVVVKKERAVSLASTKQPDPTHLDIRLPNGIQLALTITESCVLSGVLRELAALTC
jgi:hypothetical protein